MFVPKSRSPMLTKGGQVGLRLNPENSIPHSTLNLVTKSKVSSNIYKFQARPSERLHSGLHPKGSAKQKSFFDFSSIALGQFDNNLMVEERQGLKTTRASNYRQFPRRTLFRRSQGPSPISSPETSPRQKLGFFDITMVGGQSIEFRELLKSRLTPSSAGKVLRRRKDGQKEKRSHTSQTRMRWTQKFSPWDMESGFGKQKRF